MKKTLLMMLVVLGALSVRATFLNFGLDGTDSVSSKFDGGTVYAMWAPTGSEINWSNLFRWDHQAGTYTVADLQSFGLNMINATENAGMFTLNLGEPPLTSGRFMARASDVGGDTGSRAKTDADLYVLVLAKDGTDVAYSSKSTQTITTGDARVVSVLFGSDSFSTASTTMIPEPTSGVMLLLGLAGLFLRRKRI